MTENFQFSLNIVVIFPSMPHLRTFFSVLYSLSNNKNVISIVKISQNFKMYYLLIIFNIVI